MTSRTPTWAGIKGVLSALAALAAVGVSPPVASWMLAADGRIDNGTVRISFWGLSGISVLLALMLVATRNRAGFWRGVARGLWRRRASLAITALSAAMVAGLGVWLYAVHRNHVDLFARIDPNHSVTGTRSGLEAGGETAKRVLAEHFAGRASVPVVKPLYLWSHSEGECEQRARHIVQGNLGRLYEAPSYHWVPGKTIEWDGLPRRLTHRLHRLFFIYDLLAGVEEREELRRRLHFAAAFFGEWRRTNPVWPNLNLWAWNDETTAERIQAYMYLMRRWREVESVPVDEEMAFLESLVQHAERLADPDEYTARTNHGVMQNNGLLAVALQYPEMDRGGVWRRTALDRQQDYLRRMVTERGVLREVTPHYHYFVVRMLCWFLASCRKADMPLAEDFEPRLRRMLVFCRQVLNPDRSLPRISDTYADEVPDLSHWPWHDLPEWPELHSLRQVLEDARTPPNRPGLWCWRDAGYVLLRVPAPDWTVESAVMLTFRVGPESAAHKHPDALAITLFANGRPLLVGPDYPHYFDPERRSRLIRTVRQSTVSVDGLSQRIGASALCFLRPGERVGGEPPPYAAMQGESRLYDGVVHRRTVLWGPAAGAILIVDELASDRSRVYRQHFHLASGLAAELAAGKIAVLDPTRASDVPVLRIHGWTVEKGRVESSRAAAAGQVATFHVDARRAVLVALLDSSGGSVAGGLRVDSDAIEWCGQRGTLTVRLPIAESRSCRFLARGQASPER